MTHLEGVRAAFEMEAAARSVVHALKYEGIRSLATRMAASLGGVAGEPVDAAFAVPLHRSRVHSRGFNQAELILEALGWQPRAGDLRRTRKIKTQVGMHLGERRTNVSGAFDYIGPKLTGMTVGVIDDVVTTGATANECAAVLLEHGARSVVAFAFARASYNPDKPSAAIAD
jgi:ComF family protein